MPFTAAELAARCGGRLIGPAEVLIEDGASWSAAGPGRLTFLTDEKLLSRMVQPPPAAILTTAELAGRLPADEHTTAVIVVEQPQDVFAEALTWLRPPRPRKELGVSPQAYVAPSARIGRGTNVYPGAYIGEDVVIGEDCEIHPGAHLGDGCALGNHVIVHANAVLYPDVVVGERVIIHAAAVIGADGFGYRLVDGRHRKIPQLGTVIIEDDVEIGAGTTIDRGTIDATVIGAGSKIDNQVMIAHNCKLGKHNILVSQVGFAGSVTTGDYVICAGQVGVADHVHLGTGAVFGSKCGVPKDAPGGRKYLGVPAQPASDTVRQVMALKKLPEMRKELAQLSEEVARLRAALSEGKAA